MTARVLHILLLLLFTLADVKAQISYQDSLLRSELMKYGQARVKVSMTDKTALNILSEKVSVSNLNDRIAEVVLSPLTIDWFISRKFKYNIIERPDNKSVITAVSVKEAMEWDTYPSYTQYDSIMRSFSVLYPSLCVLDTIGTSIYGKLVMVVKISDNVDVDENEPEVFYTSTMHGDETLGFVLMLRLADYLLENYGSDPEITDMVDNLEIWINPLANPDGTYRTGNTILNPVRANANGYDLNRNFPDPGLTGVVRQKETIDMMAFMQEHHFVISANFHSGAEVVNYPWDRWSRLHPDDEWFSYISRKYADTVHVYAPSGYMDDLQNGVTNGYDWYSIRGGRQDYVTYELQGREVTIELDDTYVTPVYLLEPLWQYNWRSMLGYLENAMWGINGTVTDAVTGEPVAARIFINGHDTDSSQVYTDPVTGTFTRLIAEGTWSISFSAPGYYETVIKDITLTRGGAIDLSVELFPVVSPYDTISTPVLRIYPNPSKEYCKVILPQRHHGNINIKIYNSGGLILKDYDENSSAGYPLHIETGGLTPGAYILMITNLDTGFSDIERIIVLRK